MTDYEEMQLSIQSAYERVVAVWTSPSLTEALQRLSLALTEMSKAIVRAFALLRFLRRRTETPRQRKYRLRDERRKREMTRQYEAWQRRQEKLT